MHVYACECKILYKLPLHVYRHHTSFYTLYFSDYMSLNVYLSPFYLCHIEKKNEYKSRIYKMMA